MSRSSSPGERRVKKRLPAVDQASNFGDDSSPMRVCPTCGCDFVFAPAIRPDAATVAEMLCACPGRFWLVDRATAAVLRVVDQPSLDDGD